MLGFMKKKNDNDFLLNDRQNKINKKQIKIRQKEINRKQKLKAIKLKTSRLEERNTVSFNLEKAKFIQASIRKQKIERRFSPIKKASKQAIKYINKRQTTKRRTKRKISDSPFAPGKW